MALIVHRKSPALTRLLTLYARARRTEQGVAMAHRRRADSFSPIRWRGGGDRPHHRGRPGRPAAAELWGLLRQHPLRRSTEAGLLAALAPRFGGSADGADRSQKIARVNPLAHPLRAREADRAGRCDGPPTPR